MKGSGDAVVVESSFFNAAFGNFRIPEVSLIAEGTNTKVEVDIGATVTNDTAISASDIGCVGVIGKVEVINNGTIESHSMFFIKIH